MRSIEMTVTSNGPGRDGTRRAAAKEEAAPAAGAPDAE